MILAKQYIIWALLTLLLPVSTSYLHAVRLYEDVVQAAVKSCHIVGVVRLTAGAQQRREGREQLHTAGLLRPRAAPVCMLLRNRGLGDQLQHTCTHQQQGEHPSASQQETSRTNWEAEAAFL